MRISCFLHASIMNQDTMGWKRFWKSNLDILNVLRFKYESAFIRYIEHHPRVVIWVPCFRLVWADQLKKWQQFRPYIKKFMPKFWTRFETIGLVLILLDFRNNIRNFSSFGEIYQTRFAQEIFHTLLYKQNFALILAIIGDTWRIYRPVIEKILITECVIINSTVNLLK